MRCHESKMIFTLICGFMLFTTRVAAQSFNFTTLDVPCSAAPPTNCPNGVARQTVASGINPAGDIVGVFTDGVGGQHGFLLSGGQFATIDVPGALVGVVDTLPTSTNGINPGGDIVGSYTTPFILGVSNLAPQDSPAYCPAAGSPACIKGFLYRHGMFSTVLFPGHPGAIPQRITPEGDIFGCLHDFDLMNSMFGAAWRRQGDSSLTANGGELSDPSQSTPMSMNNGATPAGRMTVGLWNDRNGHRHGFVVQNGSFQSYDATPNSLLTAIWDVNPSQQFVGTYVDNTGHRHGFLQLPDGSATINVDYPGASATVAFGINPGGVIVGQYSASGHVHGFVAVPVSSN